jgi:VanZ family protein
MFKTLISALPIRAITAGGFFLFICWIIYTADKGQVHPLLQQFRVFPYSDKVGHFLLYGLLAFVVNLALSQRKIKLFSHHVPLGALLVGIFAILEEFTQIAFATRNFEWMDMLCDIVGIIFFSQISAWVIRWMDKEKPALGS